MTRPKSKAELETLFEGWRNAKPASGPLAVEAFAKGMHVCYLNAKGLLEDARLLAANDRLPRAFALSVLAFEELAKVPLLCCPDPLAPPRDANWWKRFWKEFRQHGPKQQAGVEYGRMFTKVPWLKLNNQNFGWLLSRLKERSLYVDCLDEDFKPVESFIESVPAMLEYLFAAVEERVDAFGELHETEEMSVAFLQRTADQRAGKDQAEPAFRSHTPAKSVIELCARLRSSLSHCVHYEDGPEVVADVPKIQFLSKHFVLVHESEMLRQAVEEETVNLRVRLGIKALGASDLRATAMLDLLSRFIGSSVDSGANRV